MRSRGRGLVFWMTGLSGSGKTTLSKEVVRLLETEGRRVCLLDGDEMREGINADLDFSRRDRCESLRRAAHMAATIADLDVIVLVAMISPFRDDRARARAIIGDDRFVETHVKVTLDEARERDPKGLYEKVDAGEIDDFTGISDPYEEPESPELEIETEALSVEEAARLIVEIVREREGSGVSAQ